MDIYITSGDRPSNSRLALQKGGPFRKLKQSTIFKKGDCLINWGCSKLSYYKDGSMYGIKILNPTTPVNIASNKLIFFKNVGDLSVVPWTDDQSVAQQWASQGEVVVRNKLTGHSGDGILIIEKDGSVPQAPLYTKYIPKTQEYRVHVVGKDVIDVQRKVRDPKQEPKTWKVRSHANGFIFIRNGVVLPSHAADLAVAATAACGLDFGAVDIILDKHGNAYVLEINTAPGLEGATVDSYVKALKALCQ